MSFIIANLKIFMQTFQSSTKSSNLQLCEEKHTAEDFVRDWNVCTYKMKYIFQFNISYIYIGFCEFFLLYKIFLIVKFRCRNVTSLLQPMLRIVVCWTFYYLHKKLCRYSKSIKSIQETNVRIFLPLVLNICMKNLSVWSIVFAWHEKQKCLHVRQTFN